MRTECDGSGKVNGQAVTRVAHSPASLLEVLERVARCDRELSVGGCRVATEARPSALRNDFIFTGPALAPAGAGSSLALPTGRLPPKLTSTTV